MVTDLSDFITEHIKGFEEEKLITISATNLVEEIYYVLENNFDMECVRKVLDEERSIIDLSLAIEVTKNIINGGHYNVK